MARLSLEAQVKLLRILQEGEIERLGGRRTIHVDVRIVAATTRNLEEMIAKKQFRADLHYRLNVFPITVPPLRERVEDIPALAWKFVETFSDRMGRRIDGISQNSMDALQQHSWPGNVRELRNTVGRAMISDEGTTLRIEAPARPTPRGTTLVSLAEAERVHVFAVLKSCDWKIRGRGGAAEILCIQPSTLESRVKKLNLTRQS
ncbi:MAG: sigma 54-interacting transcriptional regulator [Roseibacillus sp.]